MQPERTRPGTPETSSLDAARAWAGAPKRQVGAVALPADPTAASAFAALFSARGELACHVGGEAAALVAAAALAEASPTL